MTSLLCLLPETPEPESPAGGRSTYSEAMLKQLKRYAQILILE